jgi:Na+-transporting NADH:ubiquinone oxidoreductase subunit NqrD
MSKINEHLVKKHFSHSFFLQKISGSALYFKMAVISIIIGFGRNSFCRIFQSLEWATNFRENHLWLIALLPVAGFLIGLCIIIGERC